MTSGAFSDYLVHEWLDSIGQNCWVALNYDSPILDITGFNEISGGGYTRLKGLFTPPTGRSIWNASDLVWTGLAATTVTHFSLWDEVTNGNMLAYGPLEKKKMILNGNGYVLAEGRLAISIG